MGKTYKTDCFGFCLYSSGGVKCKALHDLECESCKFYKTREDYNKNVLPLKHKK